MQQPLITDKGKDPLGNAVQDFFKGQQLLPLVVKSSKFDDDELPVHYLFRSFAQMPGIEQKALEMATGNILDVGAGAGCHSKALQKMGKRATSIDISPGAVELMQQTGIENARHIDFFDLEGQTFDTILFLMNGAGVAGTIENLPTFFAKLKSLLSTGGQVLVDSTDVKYLYENEDGSYDIDLNSNYYGEFDFNFEYNSQVSDTFSWFYIDIETLSQYAEASGFKVIKIMEDDNHSYLAQIVVA